MAVYLAESAQSGEQFSASLLTPSACFGAHAAVLVHVGVSLALSGAGTARGSARFQNDAGDVCVVAGVAGQHIRCCEADV